MSRLHHFQTYQRHYEVSLVCLYFFINATILATSVIMESNRQEAMPFKLWEPFVWEYSSALATIALLPGIVWLLNRFPLRWPILKKMCFIYVPSSLIFSLFHVGLMVLIRKIYYWAHAMHYDFGDVFYELFYEYRKDLWSFFSFILFILGYRIIMSRLQGEAKIVKVGEEMKIQQSPDRLLVKKLGKEFILRVEDIEWLEAAGNYVNLHSAGRIYPIRSTLKQLLEQIGSKGFTRIHRSYGVNLDAIELIEPQPSGDSEITTQSGQKLHLSRRYKDEFKSALAS